MTVRLLLCCLVVLVGQAQATVFTSTVIDAVTRKPLAYVNVGIPAKGLGTVTDEEGRFSLDIPVDAETLVFSIIGYSETRLSLRTSIPAEILLSKRQTHLGEVVVRPRNSKLQTLGNRTKNKSNSVSISGRLGWGIGTLMHIDRQPVFIEQLQFNILDCTYDSLFVQVNIYEQINGEFINVPNEPLYLHIAKPDPKLNEIHVDLRSKNISVTHDFLVTMELVRIMGPGKLSFCARKRGSHTYMRFNPGTKWTHTINSFDLHAVGISAVVSK